VTDRAVVTATVKTTRTFIVQAPTSDLDVKSLPGVGSRPAGVSRFGRPGRIRRPFAPRTWVDAGPGQAGVFQRQKVMAGGDA
jgi:hypothetical protein